MNCLDYRRELLAGFGENEPMRAHRVACATCSELFAEQETFEGRLREALEVPVADGFGERLADSIRQPRSAAAPATVARRRFLAAAAAGVGAVALGLYAWLGRDDPMAMACIQFVMKEETKSIMMGAMPRAAAAEALAATLPLERIERIGKVMHIGPCPFQGGTAYHVVMMVPQDKVTLLIMPGVAMTRRVHAAHDGMHASVVPLRGGSVGIVGASEAVVESVAGAIRA